MKVIQMCAAILAALMLQACATNLSGNTYTRSEARTIQETRAGVITRIRAVQIEGEKGELGAIVGTVAGAALGSQIGHGGGSVVAGVLGGLAGGFAGNAVQKGANSANGIEITVKLDGTGKQVVVVQQGNLNDFQVGQHVQVVSNGNNAVVTP